ncbi:MAG: calpastatin [Verrucomicrobiaceae bacterium]|nr:calpastatin [Verrucomicrobiaceae bacterium]
MSDPFYLQRFVDAQNPVYGQVLRELQQGRKTGHWIWFIFPQISGLGQSQISKIFAIASVAEAEAYILHSILGPRLRECTQIVNGHAAHSIEHMLGDIDAMKFCSSMTLFAHATTQNSEFIEAVRRYFNAEFDPLTLAKL